MSRTAGKSSTTSPSTSTVASLAAAGDAQTRRERYGLWGRRVGITAVAAFVACGLFGVFGYRGATSVATANGYEVRLAHPSVTRGGLAADWRLRISRDDGEPITEPITIETTAHYLAAFDQNAQFPEPDGTAQDGEVTTWEYAAPDTPTFELRLDIRTQPDVEWTRDAVTTVTVGDEQIAAIEYSTWIVP